MASKIPVIYNRDALRCDRISNFSFILAHVGGKLEIGNRSQAHPGLIEQSDFFSRLNLSYFLLEPSEFAGHAQFSHNGIDRRLQAYIARAHTGRGLKWRRN